MTTKGGLENNIPKDAAVQYKVYVAVRQVFFHLYDRDVIAFLEKYNFKKQGSR